MKLFNDNWCFYRSDLNVDVSEIWGMLSAFQAVDLPHDWLIYDTKNLYRDGIGWYCKRFTLDRGEGERAILRFEGIYMDSTVYLNRQKVAEWKYGYSTFDVDMTDFLVDGENELLVQVRHQSPNSRWYSGAGIYRNVWLKQCNAVYLPLDGTYVTVKEQEKSRWKIEISTEATGQADSYRCRYRLCAPTGEARELGEAFHSDKARELGEALDPSGAWVLGEAPVADGLAELTVLVDNPLLWDVENPNCYQLEAELLDAQGRVVDAERMTVGFRTMEYTTDKGFFLNHRHLKLHGVCEHHDLGCLGSAFHKEAMRRKFRTLKEMGVNAVRTSHNMPAPELMDLADEMGILIISESFDMWELPKTKYDYARFFVEWAQRDVRSWIRRDRNHPSLLMWSIGNEIYDTHVSEHGMEITRRLMGYVRDNDPRENARITIGSNYMPWENARKCADLVKLAGYNYGEKYYDGQHAEHPDWVIYGSETASVVYSRGVYHFPLAQSCLSEVDEQCSALGNSTTSWGAQDIEKLITMDRDCEYSLGQFLWTGFDYIGEPTPYHTKNSYFGLIDTAGFPKDPYYLFQSEWRDAGDLSMVHLFPYWDWNEGQLIDVQACTTGDSVELFVNGKSQGRQEIMHGKDAGDRLMAKWQVPYEAGELLAVAYDANGLEIARQVRTSFGDSAAVVLEADKREFRADGEDLCFVTIGMVDQDGHPVENAMDYVTVQVDGPGRLLGLDNGDSTDYDQYKGDCRKLFNGKLLAVIAATDWPGEITVRVEACAGGIRGAEQGTLSTGGIRGAEQGTLSVGGIRGAELKLTAVESAVRPGVCCSENLSGRDKNCPAGSGGGWTGRIPARKLELTPLGEHKFTPDHTKDRVGVKLFPENTTDRDIAWEAVNDAGIPLGYVKVTPADDGTAVIDVRGDGPFRVRCLSKDGQGKAHVLSQLEFEADGFGQALLNPYDYISAGLYSRIVGEVAGGNEKGIAFARDGRSAAIYEGIDFGEYGADTITADIFALSGDPYELELWEGEPEPGEGRLITKLLYEKPSIWNTYQAETWKLPERLSGVRDISFVMHDKVHMKGFSFRYLEKAFQRLTGGDCTQVYGDSFRQDGDFIRDIGNNVTIVYEGMDFGEGVDHVTIWGYTPLAGNTIHLRFVPEEGEECRAIVEFPGGNGEEGKEIFQMHTFPVEGFCGKGKLELVFLPGSDFSLEALQFGK